MSRQLDINLYLALNGYPLKAIPKERIKDYMSEPHYSTDAEAILELDREMRERGWWLFFERIEVSPHKFCAFYRHPHDPYESVHAYADTEILARALAAYKALTGKEWEEV